MANIIENTLNTIRNIQNTSENIKNRMGKHRNKIPNLILAVITPHSNVRKAHFLTDELLKVNSALKSIFSVIEDQCSGGQ